MTELEKELAGAVARHNTLCWKLSNEQQEERKKVLRALEEKFSLRFKESEAEIARIQSQIEKGEVK